ncbi:DUF6192 family protein [Amycolatopsis thermoflava]|uniref:DUF6192 family protein n=1 Tax=Amycolatopsis thermoflava TaxID=84480 RepID=UPI0039778B92
MHHVLHPDAAHDPHVACQTLLESIERVRAAASWAETEINTGDTSMDEALAKMLGGES